jgi:hypothetical protein
VIEQELRDLGATLFPAEPDLRAVVAAALAPAPRRRRRRPLLALAALLLAFATAALAIPQARSAIERWLGIGAVRIVHVNTLPPLSPAPALRGRPATRSQADQAFGRPLLLPDTLAAPDAVRVTPEPGVVLGWGKPVRLRLFELVAPYPLLEKYVTLATPVVPLRIGSDRGFWIAGRHGVRFDFGQPELAGNTLIWVHDGVTLRLDGRIDRAQALVIARSVHS